MKTGQVNRACLADYFFPTRGTVVHALHQLPFCKHDPATASRSRLLGLGSERLMFLMEQ